jgi:AcrR family transcriptional regulator
MFDTNAADICLSRLFENLSMTERDDPRQRLLEAAGAAFAEKGFEGATVRDIIRRAGANIAAVNYYFRDKEQLYIEAVKNASCGAVQEPALPQWEPNTPPAEKLRDFIRVMVGRILKSNRPAWHTQLMMRELAQPTSACTEWVRDYVRPMADVLFQVLTELLPPDTPRWKVSMTGFSIVGQILHYAQNRPVVALLVGDENLRHFNPDAVAEHIAAFSLAALGQRPSPKTPRSKLRARSR